MDSVFANAIFEHSYRRLYWISLLSHWLFRTWVPIDMKSLCSVWWMPSTNKYSFSTLRAKCKAFGSVRWEVCVVFEVKIRLNSFWPNIAILQGVCILRQVLVRYGLNELTKLKIKYFWTLSLLLIPIHKPSYWKVLMKTVVLGQPSLYSMLCLR